MPLQTEVEQALRLAFASVHVPVDLQDAVVRAASDVVDHYASGRLAPSELSGGHFAEAVARVLELMATGQHTPLGKTLAPFPALMTSFANAPLDDALRIHVPRMLQLLYDVRNRRGIGHVPGSVSANRADAELILTCVKWVICEFVRLYHLSDHGAAQRLVDRLMTRHVPHVETFDGALRVVSRKKVSIPDAILVLLRASGGEATRRELSTWVRAGSAQVATAIGRLDERDLIHRFQDGRIRLTTLGDVRADEVSLTLGAHG